MNTENFAEWQRQQGHKVIRSNSAYWCEAGPRVMQAFPYHCLITPPEAEIQSLLRQGRILGLRYSTPLSAPQGKISYHLVASGNYGLGQLHGKTRKYVTQGLSNLTISPLTFSDLALKGWPLQLDTLQRHNRTSSMNESEWHRICTAAQSIPGFEAWGAWVGAELAAALLLTQVDDTMELLYLSSHRRFMHLHVNHTLYYVVTQSCLQRTGIHTVFSTLESLDAPPDIDTFKLRLAFQPRPVRQRIVFHPFLQPLINQRTHRLLTAILRLAPNAPFLSKARGMIQFHLDGKLPPIRQPIPECLKGVPLPRD